MALIIEKLVLVSAAVDIILMLWIIVQSNRIQKLKDTVEDLQEKSQERVEPTFHPDITKPVMAENYPHIDVDGR